MGYGWCDCEGRLVANFLLVSRGWDLRSLYSARGDAMTDKTLVQKLAEACNEVGGIEKKGVNQAQNYKYVKAADVAKALRRELFSRGIVCIPDESKIEWVEHEGNPKPGQERGSRMTECRLEVTFNISDGITTLAFRGWGVARDSGDKAVYKAKTGALKYFLRGLGILPDEKDDPEADESVDKAFRESSTEKATKEKPLLNDTQQRAFWSAVKAGAKTEPEVRDYLLSIGVPDAKTCPKTELAGKILKLNLDDAIQWAAKGSDMTQELKQSLEWTQASKRLWATAGEAGMVEKTVKDHAYQKYSVDSMKRLTPVQLREVTAWITEGETVPF